MTTPSSSFSSCSAPLAAVQPLRCLPGQTLCAWNEPKVAGCHSIRPPPARRRQWVLTIKQHHQRQRQTVRHGSMKNTRAGFSGSVLIAFLLCLLLLCQGASASETLGVAEIFPGELLYDRRPPPPLPPVRMQLDKRTDGSSSVSLPQVTTVTITPTSGAPSATGSGITSASQTAAVSLPSPFDTSLGNNFTSTSCPTFFQNFLNNPTFISCLPFSLLLQTSNGFFTASRSVLSLTQIMSATCDVNFNTCSNLMASLAQQIGQQSACGADLQMQNPVVIQAYNGFIAYPTLYHAGCLTDSEGNYCFVNAVTNTSATASSYIYYLPLGVQLPGSSRPACTQCMQETMAIFAQTASNGTQPLSKDYNNAAEQIQMDCGPTFVQTLAHSSAGVRGISTSFGLTGVFVLLSVLVQILS